MEYSHRYHAYPTQEVAADLEFHLDVHRQLYNHVRWDYTNSPEDDKPSEYDQNKDDEGVRVVWCGDCEADLGQGPFVSGVWVRDGLGCECGDERLAERLF